MRFLTDFADQGEALPLALLGVVALLLMRWRRAAMAWVGAVCVGFGLIALGKMWLAGCGGVPALGLRSPSGHTVAAALVLGALPALLLGAGPPVIGGAAMLAAAAIGATRLALGVHSMADIVLACLVGTLAAYALAVTAGPRPPAARIPRSGLVLAAVVVIALHGVHLDAESRLRALGQRLFGHTLCAVVRAEPVATPRRGGQA
jgi:membrane-associated phospholipid phosphatase